MQSQEAVSESAIDGRQDVTSHSAGTEIESAGTADLDALLGDHPLDPHFKRQLEQLDKIDLSHLEPQTTNDLDSASPASQAAVARNPLAPIGGQVFSTPSRSGTPKSVTSRSNTPLSCTPNSGTPNSGTPNPGASNPGTPLTGTPVVGLSMSGTPATNNSISNTPTTAIQSSRHPSLHNRDDHGIDISASPAGDATSINTRQSSVAPTDDEGMTGTSNARSNTPQSSIHDQPGNSIDEASNQDSLPVQSAMDDDSSNRVSAYARLDFESFTFYVQTLQVVLGRRSEHGGPSTDVDVHLGPAKAISRRHAKIFYNFATQRFELTVIGRNGAFVGDVFVETGSTVPLRDSTKVQIGQIAFNFVLPIQGKRDGQNGESDAEHDIDEELEIEETSDHSRKSDVNPRTKAGSGMGSTKGQGGKLKQRAESIKRKDKDGDYNDNDDKTNNETTKTSDSELRGKPSLDSKLPEPLIELQSDSKQGSHLQTQNLQTPQMPKVQLATTVPTLQQNAQSSVAQPASGQHTAPILPTQSPAAQNSDLANLDPDLTEPARNKPRQPSFLKRTDENNLFAHVPPDQLAAVNAQVDAAIAGLPDIPGFDTPAIGPSQSSAASPHAMGQRLNDTNLNQLLGLQTQLGIQQPNTNNITGLNALMGLSNNLAGFQNIQQGANPATGIQSLQQLQALQSLQGLDGLQNLSGIPGFQGLQPAAGLGLLQQLQALQRNKSMGTSQPQTRQKRKPKREYRPEEIPEQYRTKPAHSYSHLITAALRDRLSSKPDGTQGGLSLGDIYEAIMDLFPYYRYCPPGWQNSVRHNLSSSKSFRKVSKEGKGWLWGLDEEYLAEKEKQRQRALQRQQQQALAQQQAMAEQHAREQAREQARQLQLQKDREREHEQRRFLAERAARAAQVGVPLHQLSATLGTSNIHSLGSENSSLGSGFSNPGSSRSLSSTTGATGEPMASKPTVLPPETVKLLAGLQHHVQQELAKDGQPPLNPQLLSNALAVVIAQTAKQAGGLQSLGSVLQQPGAVQKLLNQAMQLLRSTQRFPTSKPEATVTASSPSPANMSQIPSEPARRVIPPRETEQQSTSNPVHNMGPVSLNTSAPSYAQIQAQPQIQPTSKVSEQHSQTEPATQKAQPQVLQPSPDKNPESTSIVSPEVKVDTQAQKRENTEKAEISQKGTIPLASETSNDTHKSGETKEVQESKEGVRDASGEPNTVSSESKGGSRETPKDRPKNEIQGAAQDAAPSPSKPAAQETPKTKNESKKQQPSLEKISEILAKAEAIPNPTPEVKGMIEKLKAHKRQLELKRAASESSSAAPSPKRPAVH